MLCTTANITESREVNLNFDKNKTLTDSPSNLTEAKISKEYIIKDIIADDQDLKDFLFTLGCYKGETIALISILAENYVITVKDARYSIDSDLARAIRL
ncbi:ferrous iron transport protein A [Oceanispirochaeta crateris]|uniref:Ferrous iron transport protein A n=2 Tax=Oceanispirochaeta crateris TaxID=2518645 RepID=A0A5C1QSE2_9SPIO|nr:ferrous iron transport protein A [Oceanispirochaeta crateris]